MEKGLSPTTAGERQGHRISSPVKHMLIQLNPILEDPGELVLCEATSQLA